MQKVRISQSIHKFKERVLLYWSMEEWKGIADKCQNVLFFGMYNDLDYKTYRIHKGQKIVFWCGGDILWCKSNYDYLRIIKLFPEAEHYCENAVEKAELENLGIKVKAVIPSFLDNIHKFPISFQPANNPHVWLSGNPEREKEYGWDLAEQLARELPDITFHLYGIDRKDNPRYYEQLGEINVEVPNLIFHGKVTEEQFNKEIQSYHCGLRPNDFDGFSEVTSKSILLGQYPITKIPYEKVWNYKTYQELVDLLKALKYQSKPNTEARAYYLTKINQYPWNTKRWLSEDDFKNSSNS